ncbi:flagellar hook-length control protein FliK [Aliarcobacter vitoriensis]|uniref:flagellar hook-length control protein FliK n=1 Tax=Aliarcobacter vitoriensis TaxID=2011099 RepID=UPI003AABD24A
MANLVDIFTQTNSTNSDTILLNTTGDLPKDKPSLFDSLLKSSIESIEVNKDVSQTKNITTSTPITQNSQALQNNGQNIENTSIIQIEQNMVMDTNKIENIDLDTKNLEQKSYLFDDNIDGENKSLEPKKEQKIVEQEIKKETNTANTGNKNSLLDRLILEVKSNNAEKLDITEHILEDTKDLKNISDLEGNNTNFLNSLDEKIDELNNSKNILKEEIVIDKKSVKNQDNKIIELVQKESLITNLTTNSIKIESLEVETKEINVPLDILDSENFLKDSNNTQKIIEPKLSLMDQLIQANSNKEVINTELRDESIVNEQNIEKILKESQNIQINEKNVEPKLSLMDQLIKESNLKDININVDKSIDVKVSKDVASNIFLADQKNILNNQILFNKNEAVKILENASSLDDIQKSANILDLEASGLQVEQDIVKEDLEKLKINDKELQDRKNILNTILNEKDVRSVDIRNLITNSIEASKALLENTLTIQDDKVVEIQPTLVNSIESRIIGAKQQLSSMMSDIARQMYENYKPPVTVFRMTLNPVDLGSISVLMKQDKTTGLNITMSISSLATLELLMDNQNMLRNSLVKTFNDSSNFNLDFSSSQNNHQNSSSNSNGKNQQSREDLDTQAILKLKEENRDLEEKTTDYM